MKAETIIICPTCSEPQIKSTKELKPGEQMKDGGWISVGYDMQYAIRMACNKCATEWHRFHPKTREPQIHTEEGWIALAKDPHKYKGIIIN